MNNSGSLTRHGSDSAFVRLIDEILFKVYKTDAALPSPNPTNLFNPTGITINIVIYYKYTS